MIEVTDQQLLSFAEEEQFFLFCDRDEFIDIAKAVLYRFAPPAEPDVRELMEALEELSSAWRALQSENDRVYQNAIAALSAYREKQGGEQ